MADVLGQINGAVGTVLARAHVEPEDVVDVVCTGGSSRIPSVCALLERIFGKPIVQHQTFTGVATGLAIAQHHGYASPLEGTS